MSVITEVMKRTGATRADIIRVATRGGDTRADWGIAHAIEAAGGRNAHDLMFTAGRDQMIAEIWGDTSAPVEAPAPTNPKAEYDETVTVYPEDTSPESPNQVTPDRLSDTTKAPSEDDQLRTRAWAAVANITHATKDAIDRMVARWTTTSAIYTGIGNVLRSSRHPRARKLRDIYVTAP